MVYGAGELQTLSDVILSVCGEDGKVLPFPEFVPVLELDVLREIGASYIDLVHELTPKSDAEKAERETDKMPSNYYFVGLFRPPLCRTPRSFTSSAIRSTRAFPVFRNYSPPN